MSRLNSLSPDLRATLSLLLRQRKSYAEVARMLSIEERAVRDRAVAALALLDPTRARALSSEQREQVGEYLLGQQDNASQQETRAYLERDTAARAWAQSLARELGPLAAKPLPPIPGTAGAGRAPLGASSRPGGAILLGAIAVVIVVVVLLIVGIGGGGGSAHTASNPSASSTETGPSQKSHTTTSDNAAPQSTTSTNATGTGTSGTPRTTRGRALELTPADPATSKAVGLAYVFTQGTRRAFYLLAKNLPTLSSGTFYAVWLEDAAGKPDYPLGSLPTAGSDGLIEGGGPLPSDAGSYKRIIVTTETTHTPKEPGPKVLGGTFSLH